MADNKEQVVEVGDKLLVRAPAKINLSLLIAGERGDGFHEIETIMSKIDLCDEIVFEPGRGKGIELICKGKYDVPAGKDNIVYRACEMLYEKAGHKQGDVRVHLTKNIPPGSGLGGGSSDAAAVIIGLNRIAGLDVSKAGVLDIANRLGSDGVFFLGGPLAFCTGRGEKIQKIEEKFSFRAILILPNVTVSTKRVYENYTHNRDLYDRLSGKINTLIRKKKIDLAAQMCANMLEISCFGLYKELGELKSRIEGLGIGRVCLSGSGSVMYCLVTTADDEDLERYQQMLEENVGCESVIVHNNRW